MERFARIELGFLIVLTLEGSSGRPTPKSMVFAWLFEQKLKRCVGRGWQSSCYHWIGNLKQMQNAFLESADVSKLPEMPAQKPEIFASVEQELSLDFPS